MAGAMTPRDQDEIWLHDSIIRTQKPRPTDDEVDMFCDDVLYRINDGADVPTARIQAFESLMRDRHESR